MVACCWCKPRLFQFAVDLLNSMAGNLIEGEVTEAILYSCCEKLLIVPPGPFPGLGVGQVFLLEKFPKRHALGLIALFSTRIVAQDDASTKSERLLLCINEAHIRGTGNFLIASLALSVTKPEIVGLAAGIATFNEHSRNLD